jgi:hypothetical protein
LRKKLEQSTNGINSATILIADRRGREEIVKAIRGLPSGVQSRLTSSISPTQDKPKPEAPIASRAFWRNWIEILLPAAIGMVVYLLFSIK